MELKIEALEEEIRGKLELKIEALEEEIRHSKGKIDQYEKDKTFAQFSKEENWKILRRDWDLLNDRLLRLNDQLLRLNDQLLRLNDQLLLLMKEKVRLATTGNFYSLNLHVPNNYQILLTPSFSDV